MRKSVLGLVAVCLLGFLSACQNGALTPQGAATINNVVASGQLFCGVASAAGPLVVAIVNAADSKAVTVTDKTSAVVAATCKVIGGLPVIPPSNPAAAPVVAIVPPA